VNFHFLENEVEEPNGTENESRFLALFDEE